MHVCIPSAAFGMKSTVLVLQRKFSPLPSIQIYITWTPSSGCGSVMYPAVTFLSSSAIVRVTTARLPTGKCDYYRR